MIATGDGYQTNEPWGDRKISIPCDLDFDSQRGESTACKASRVSIPMLDGAVVAWDNVRVFFCETRRLGRLRAARRASIAMTRFTNAQSRNVEMG